MTDKHLDVYFECDGKRYYVGHGDVSYSKDIVEQAGMVSTLLHQIAWEYEENAQRIAEDGSGQDVREFRPRKAWNLAGDFFYEVVPEKFVAGMSHEDAVSSFRTFGGASHLDDLKKVYPGLRVDYV